MLRAKEFCCASDGLPVLTHVVKIVSSDGWSGSSKFHSVSVTGTVTFPWLLVTVIAPVYVPGGTAVVPLGIFRSIQKGWFWLAATVAGTACRLPLSAAPVSGSTKGINGSG